MDLTEQRNQQENENNQILLSLKEPEELDEPDLEYNHHTNISYDDDLNQSVHIPMKKKLVKKQIILDDFGENSSDEEEKCAANIDWREVESVTNQSSSYSDHDKSLLSVDLMEEGINPNDIPKEFPEKSCYITIQRIIISLFSSIKAYFGSFSKNNKKNQ